MGLKKLIDLDLLNRFLEKIKALIPTTYAGSDSAGGPATIASGIHYAQVDSTSTSTEFTATVPGVTEYYDGLTILLKNGIVGSASDFTINVNGLGAKGVYSNMAESTRETTQFGSGYTILLVYDSTRVSGGCWINYRGYYNDSNSVGYQLKTNSTVLKASDQSRYYRLFFTSVDGVHWVPANTSKDNSATSQKTVNQRPINPFGRIIYYSATTNLSAESNLSAAYCWDQYSVSLGYSFNKTGAELELTTKTPVYIKCAPQADGSAIIDDTTPYVQSLPSSADGKIYIFLGIAYDETHVELTQEHPIYYHDGTGIRLWSGADYMTGMTILSYGISTWADFIAAYNSNKVVYCRASSNSNPASGSQTRMAFMAYINNQADPTEVEFQYYRSVSSHSDSQQGDQVFVYKLSKTAGWTVTTRNAFSKVVAGTGLSSSYDNGTITLASTYESKAAVSGGTDVSLVTTGEKYTWNRGMKVLDYGASTWSEFLSAYNNNKIVYCKVENRLSVMSYVKPKFVNHFNPETITPDTLILANGAERASTGWCCSDYISVAVGDNYVLSGSTNYPWDGSSVVARIHGYSNGSWSQQVAYEALITPTNYSIEFTIPEGVNSIRISIPNSTNVIVGSYGTEPDFVEFQYYESVIPNTASQQSDTVSIYKLASDGAWTTVTRDIYRELPSGGSAGQVLKKASANDYSVEWADDTTYESKAAASGGTDVSLVTTGEKYIWNNKGTYSKPSGGIPDSDIASAATWNAKGNGTITGITMNGASKGTSGVVDLGTVITVHQDISGKADKSATVSNVAYDSTNKKITKTINGTTSDVVSVATLKSAMSLAKGDVGLGNVDNVKQYSASNPPPYPVTSVNGSTGAVTVSVPSAGTATPKMDGTAAVGSSTKYAKEDHVHPVDTSRAPASHTHSADNILGGYINIHPENNPTLIPFMHNDIAHLLKRGGSAIVKYDGTQQTVDISSVFDGSGSYWGVNPTGITTIVIELTLHKVVNWTTWVYADFGAAGWRANSISIDVINTNYVDDVWTNKYQTINNTLGHIAFVTFHTPVGASNAGGGFNKIRFTFSSWASTTLFRIAQLGIYYSSSIGLRETYMSRGIDDAVFRSITPNANVTYNLGSSSNKWNHVYTKYLNDTEIPASPKFTDNTYESKSAASGGTAVSLVTTGEKYTWNNKGNGTITGITMNGASKGTSGVVDLGTVITAHQSLTGKQDKLVSGTNIKTINGNSLLGSGNLTVSGLPAVTSSDNDKVLKVVNGAWAAAEGGGGSSLPYTDAILHVKAPLNSSLTFTKGSTSERLGPEAAHPNADGVYGDWYYNVESSDFGAWQITAALNNHYDTTTVSPSEARQYDVLLRYTMHLFDNGDQCTAITGGWKSLAGGGNIITDSVMRITPNADGQAGHRSIVTTNKINPNGRTILKVKFISTYSGYVSDPAYRLEFGLSGNNTTNGDYWTGAAHVTASYAASDEGNVLIASLDISDYKNSENYIRFDLLRDAADILEVWLEW